jgi:hypothetical protein
MPPIIQTGRLPTEQRYVTTIATTSEKDKKEEKERQMKFYPFMKKTTPRHPLITMMKQLLEEVPLFL